PRDVDQYINFSSWLAKALLPYWPLISFPIDLSTVIDDYMYMGFSASTGVLAATHNSFRIGGRAQDLYPKELPSLMTSSEEVVHRKGFVLTITLTIIIFVVSDVILPPLPHGIHLEESKVMEFSNDSDPSNYSMTSSLSSSFKSFDKIVASRHAPLVLSLGLLCSHPHPNCRPNMRRIVQFLLGDAGLPPLPLDIHLQIPRAMMEHWDVSPDDSDPSYSRMTTSKSNSSTSFDRKVTVNQGTGVTF
ncbi:l-type lectin-domain containing receptor kinase iv.3, partial [Quercus suber]